VRSTSDGDLTQNGRVPGEIIEAVQAFLDLNHKPYKIVETSLEGVDILEIELRDESVSAWQLFAIGHDQNGILMFRSSCDELVPESKRPEVAELLTRANSDTMIGSFDLDFEDGAISFRTSIDVLDTAESLTPVQVGHLFWRNVLEAGHWQPAIRAVLHGERSPQEAVLMVEEMPWPQEW